ncbi:MAG: transporter substrate-binding domain-containing protein, partial [Lactobacillus apis]|nr:transporter substrate-binding domain-containing protein [Lactobacillus apis]
MKKNKLKRRIAIWSVVIVVLLVTFFGFRSSLNDSTGGSDSSVVAIKKRGVLRVAVFGDLPPYGWVDEHGNRRGYDLRLARRMAKDLGVKAKFTQVNANNRVDTLNSDKADIVLANFTVTPERKQVADFA